MLILAKLYSSLNIYQQSHYNIKDYLKYYSNNIIFYFLIPLLISLLYFINHYLFIVLDLYSLLFFIFKVKLKFTKRVLKIIILSFLLFPILLIPYCLFIFIFFEFLLIPIYLIEYYFIEYPRVKKTITKAKNKINNYDGTIIGVVGSAGKTTTKNFIADIFHSIKTPKSYNTLLGISNYINDTYLYTDNVVIEMGISKINDMDSLVELVKPKVVFLTNILPMHIDGLKNIDVIYQEKIKAFKYANVSVCNFESEYIRNNFSNPTISYGFNHGDYRAKNINNNNFDLFYKNNYITTIYSNCNSKLEILDLLGVLAYYHYLGKDFNNIKLELLNLFHEKNRLEIKGNNKHIILDDSYNSNILGFKEALKKNSINGRRILITPGIVELGIYNKEINKELALYIAGYIDDAIIVANKRLYLELKKYQINVYNVISFKEGYKLYKKIMSNYEKTSLLIENDLPDIYRRRLFI